MTEDGLMSVLTSVVDRGLWRVPILGQARAVMEDRLDGLSMRLKGKEGVIWLRKEALHS